jgi:hypothetical protein
MQYAPFMKHTITTILLFCGFYTLAQENSERKVVDAFIKGFNLKMDTVYWLCEYDEIAWWTSDSVLATSKEEQAKLGSEWFCIKRGNIWHAVYGKFQDNNFAMIYHYEADSNQLVKRVYTQIDSLSLNSYSRALVNSNKFVSAFPGSLQVRFNQYIRRNSDQSLSVWFLPAFTTSNIAVYGGEFYYVFDSTGNNLVFKNEYVQGYKGFKPDSKKEIWLNYESREEPTLGSIFFIWYYRKYFNRIVVDAKKFKSTLFHDKEKGYYWVHAVKD